MTLADVLKIQIATNSDVTLTDNIDGGEGVLRIVMLQNKGQVVLYLCVTRGGWVIKMGEIWCCISIEWPLRVMTPKNSFTVALLY